MFKTTVLANWILTSDEAGAVYRANLILDYPLEVGVVDRIENLGSDENVEPDPNLNLWEIICDQATLDAIEADPNYYVYPDYEEIIKQDTP